MGSYSIIDKENNTLAQNELDCLSICRFRKINSKKVVFGHAIVNFIVNEEEKEVRLLNIKKPIMLGDFLQQHHSYFEKALNDYFVFDSSIENSIVWDALSTIFRDRVFDFEGDKITPQSLNSNFNNSFVVDFQIQPRDTEQFNLGFIKLNFCIDKTNKLILKREALDSLLYDLKYEYDYIKSIHQGHIEKGNPKVGYLVNSAVKLLFIKIIDLFDDSSVFSDDIKFKNAEIKYKNYIEIDELDFVECHIHFRNKLIAHNTDDITARSGKIFTSIDFGITTFGSWDFAINIETIKKLFELVKKVLLKSELREFNLNIYDTDLIENII